MRIGIAVGEGAFASGLTGLIDVFDTAERLRPSVSPDIPPFEIRVLAAERNLMAKGRLHLVADGPLDEVMDVDLAIVAGAGATNEQELEESLGSRSNRALVSALGRLTPTTPYAAACTGTFVLAEAGLLDGRRATTSWWLSGAFRRRHPSTTLDMDAMVVTDGLATTGGAAFAHVDLALVLVGRSSPELARLVARFLIIDERAAQTSYAAIAHLDITDVLVREFEHHVRRHLAEPLDIGRVAKVIGTSRRTLERRTHAALGTTPLGLVRRLRVERAQHLLLLGYGIDVVAAQVGYVDPSTVRALLRSGRPRALQPRSYAPIEASSTATSARRTG